jgi:ribosomal protein S18 acetylase RimI-like enzyme
MDCGLRRVRPVLAEAAAVLSVEQESLGDSPYTPEEVLRALQRPEHYAYVACEDGQVVGFLSCLETSTCSGLRLELDLLGVRAEHRGKGIATSLIRMAIEEAERRGTHRFRSVVAKNNAASQAAFRRAGLSAGGPATLLVYEILGREPVDFLPPGWDWLVKARRTPSATAPSPEEQRLLDERGELVATAICQQVQTLSYRGVWIEELRAGPRVMGTALRAIIERAKILDLDQVGHLAGGIQADGELDVWLRQGYRNLGPYYVFTMD